MPFKQSGAIKYYTFASLENQGLKQAVFTRQGGFSSTPWHSLNFGASVGDDIQKVIRNREIALQALYLHPDSIYDVFQIHSTDVVKTEKPLSPTEIHIKADAIITNQPNVTLLMRFADCTPILLFDPNNRAIGVVHAGWIGTVEKIAKKAVLAMVENYGTNPQDILAAIGPSIGPDHYSIGNEVLERVHTSFPANIDKIIINKNKKTYFDLWKANRIILSEAGVEKIETAEICTSCNLNDWYSHRGEHGKTGRFGMILGLQK
jgi:YfiH family protein